MCHIAVRDGARYEASDRGDVTAAAGTPTNSNSRDPANEAVPGAAASGNDTGRVDHTRAHHPESPGS